MNLRPAHVEINHHTIRLIIGVIALSIAPLVTILATVPLDSISASYYANGWSRNIFVGFLFAISAFFLAYNGRSLLELILSKVITVTTMGVAMFPCACGDHVEIVPYVHYVSATVMFLSLAFFCYSFFKRAYEKGHLQAVVRAYIYIVCGFIIVMSILVLALNFLVDGAISHKVTQLVFYGEAAALISFGIAWLTASRILPIITHKDERVSISPFTKET